MITLVSLPMFIAGAIGLAFLIYSIVFFTIFMKDSHTKKHFKYFVIITLVNTLYMTFFGILLNLGTNVNAINFTNRATLIASTYVVVFFFQLLDSMFDFKQKKAIKIIHIIAGIFAIILWIDHPLILISELEQTSSYYMALQKGLVHKIWGAFILMLLAYTSFHLFKTYKKIPDTKNKYKSSVFVLLIFSIFWVISGGVDALTSMGVLDIPPVSWVGSLSIVITAAILLLNSYEHLDDTVHRLYDELIHDALTGAYSKSFFDIELNKVMAKLRREPGRNYLIVFDIDNFKKINDQFGHVCGDFILRELIRTVREQLRINDILARFGGDEFLILIEFSPPEMDITNMMARIQDAIRKREYNFNGQAVQVSCSFGGAFLDNKVIENMSSTEDILVIADNALYEAKRQGKDRFVLNEGDFEIN